MSFLKAMAKGALITFLLLVTIGFAVGLFWELFGSGGGSPSAMQTPAPQATTVLAARTPTKDDPDCRPAPSRDDASVLAFPFNAPKTMAYRVWLLASTDQSYLVGFDTSDCVYTFRLSENPLGVPTWFAYVNGDRSNNADFTIPAGPHTILFYVQKLDTIQQNAEGKKVVSVPQFHIADAKCVISKTTMNCVDAVTYPEIKPTPPGLVT